MYIASCMWTIEIRKLWTEVIQLDLANLNSVILNSEFPIISNSFRTIFSSLRVWNRRFNCGSLTWVLSYSGILFLFTQVHVLCIRLNNGSYIYGALFAKFQPDVLTPLVFICRCLLYFLVLHMWCGFCLSCGFGRHSGQKFTALCNLAQVNKLQEK